jgi:hypothetical protein
MGPTWIVVIVFKPAVDGGDVVTTVEEFSDETIAHARYMVALRLNYRHVYLASVRGEAH